MPFRPATGISAIFNTFQNPLHLNFTDASPDNLLPFADAQKKRPGLGGSKSSIDQASLIVFVVFQQISNLNAVR